MLHHFLISVVFIYSTSILNQGTKSCAIDMEVELKDLPPHSVLGGFTPVFNVDFKSIIVFGVDVSKEQ